jgi:hypothetical protein
LIALGDIKGKDIGRSSCRSEAMKEKPGLPQAAGNNTLGVNNKRSTTPTNDAHKDKDMAIIAQAEDAASQRHKETNCVVLTALVQSTITEVAQNLEMLKLYTVGSDEFNEILKEIKDFRIKLKSYKDKLHKGNEKRETPDQVTSYFGTSKMNKINDDNSD